MWWLLTIFLHGFVALLLFLCAYITHWNSRRIWDCRAAVVDVIVSVVVSAALIFYPWGWAQLFVIALAAGVLKGQHESAPRILPRQQETRG